VEHVGQLKNELAREALKLNRIEHSMEISSLADIPASTGLGSSSCYLVGLLMALHTYRKDYISLLEIAEEACRIELDVLSKGIGKQDQYMAAFGGMTVLDIARNGKVRVRQLNLSSWAIAELVSNCHIYYLQKKRDAIEVLEDQNRAMREKTVDSARVEESLLNIKDLGLRILKAIENEDFDSFGKLMDEHWQNKKKLSSKISYKEIDALYDHVKKEYDVLGGKIIGAGGGGFLMLYSPEKKKDLTAFMRTKGYFRLHYTVEFEGTKVVANLRQSQELGDGHR
jgi:D-glycero-alpha-D-manno-heptose-7-phosphate kinase